jgi:hypothetical protein
LTQVRKASTAWVPIAVSAESMTASVPSKTALATSDASARVGRLLVTMLSSISVAVTTGTPAKLAAVMIRFWAVGGRAPAAVTSSLGLSPQTPVAPPPSRGAVVDALRVQRFSRSVQGCSP